MCRKRPGSTNNVLFLKVLKKRVNVREYQREHEREKDREKGKGREGKEGKEKGMGRQAATVAVLGMTGSWLGADKTAAEEPQASAEAAFAPLWG